MVDKSGFRWPPQASTVIGLGALKILVPDHSTVAGQVLEAIEVLAQPVGRLLQAIAQQPPVASGSTGFNPASPCRLQPEE